MVVSEASGTQNIFKTGKFRAGIAFTICQYGTVAFDGKQPQRAEIRIKLACVASVSIWFRSKERLVLAAREALLPVPFFARSLTLVPRSLFLNHTETLATQPSIKVNKNFCLEYSFRKNRTTFQMFRCCYQFWSNLVKHQMTIRKKKAAKPNKKAKRKQTTKTIEFRSFTIMKTINSNNEEHFTLENFQLQERFVTPDCFPVLKFS